MEVIKVNNFKKSYGPKVVHRGVSFTVNEGECLGLIGGSGSGKSVILRSLIGLEKADEGSISIKGRDITRFEEEDLIDIRKNVSYVFQNGALFDSMSVYENLAYPLRNHTDLSEEEIEKKVLNTLKSFGLEGTEGLYPSSLSGGMQKRMGLSRSIIMDPEIILFDEPTAGLDPFNTKRIQENILKLKKLGVTSILVTHDMPSAFAVCDRIAILNEGLIAAIGTVEELKEGKAGLIQQFIDGEIVQHGYK